MINMSFDGKLDFFNQSIIEYNKFMEIGKSLLEQFKVFKDNSESLRGLQGALLTAIKDKFPYLFGDKEQDLDKRISTLQHDLWYTLGSALKRKTIEYKIQFETTQVLNSYSHQTSGVLKFSFESPAPRLNYSSIGSSSVNVIKDGFSINNDNDIVDRNNKVILKFSSLSKEFKDDLDQEYVNMLYNNTKQLMEISKRVRKFPITKSFDRGINLYVTNSSVRVGSDYNYNNFVELFRMINIEELNHRDDIEEERVQKVFDYFSEIENFLLEKQKEKELIISDLSSLDKEIEAGGAPYRFLVGLKK